MLHFVRMILPQQLLVLPAALEGEEKRVEGNNNNLVHRYDYIIVITIYIIKIIFSCHHDAADLRSYPKTRFQNRIKELKK